MVDLSNDKIACGGLVAAVGSFEPDGRFLVIDRDGTKSGGGDVGGWDVTQAGTESESSLFASGEGVTGYLFTRQED